MLLVGMAVAAIWMSALLPAWRQQAQREREAEFFFRAEQYARAIVLYNRKFGTLPPSIDALVEGHFLRKKYKDPITGCDWVPIGVGIPATTQSPCPSQAKNAISNSFDPANQGAQTINPVQGGQPGISGVRSLSTDTSIRIYQNQQQYNLFPFDYQLYCQRMGGCGQPGGNNQGRPGGAGPGGNRPGGAGPGGAGPGGAGPGGAGPGGAGPGGGRPGGGRPGGAQGGRQGSGQAGGPPGGGGARGGGS